MTKKTLGYVELEWTCVQCGTRNPGPQKSCSSCGSPQPKKAAFHQAAEEELISDQAELARAKAGPDVHCAFCGARNPASAEKCTQCGADLSSAEARESGRVVGAHRSGPAEQVQCPNCGALNDPNALKCAQCNASLPRADRPARKARSRPSTTKSTRKARSRRPVTAAKKPARKLGVIGILGIAALALFLCGVCYLIVGSQRTTEVVGQVRAVSWTRVIEIEELRADVEENWREQIPAGAVLGRCSKKYHHTQDSPAPGATEVCGTPYTVDTGTGYGKVVQDCEYKVYKDWCEYEVEKWQVVDEISLGGEDYDPQWPNLRMGPGQREGERQEKYKVVFDTEDKSYTYTTGDQDRFSRCRIGSQWVLKVNKFGGVTSIEPSR